MQKVKSIPSKSAATAESSSQVSELTDTNLVTEGQRRVRKSAAMLGLALSMGATGMFIHNQDDAAMAAESFNRDPALTTLPILGEIDANSAQTQVSVQPAPMVAEPSALPVMSNLASPTSAVAIATEQIATAKAAIQETKSASGTIQASETVVTEPAPPVIKHQVKEGETLWELSQNYAITPQAIASSNQIKADATLKVGQNLKIPTANGIVQELKQETTTTELASTYGIKPEQIKVSGTVTPATKLLVGETVAISGEVDQLMQKRQEIALENLQQETQNLEQQLTKLPTTTNKTSVEIADATTGDKAHASQLPNNASGSTLKTETQIQVIFPEPPKLSLNPSKESEAVISNQQLPTPKPVAIPEVPGNITTKPQEQQLASPQSQGIEIPIQPQATTPVTQPGIIANQPIEIPVIPPVSSSVNNTPQYSPAQQSTVTIPASVNNANHASFPMTTGNKQAATPVPTLINVEAPKPVVIASAPVSLNSNQVYQVRRGDTLNTIARRYGLSSQQLARANNINNPNLIKINQPLTIPGQVTANRQPETLIPGSNPVGYAMNPAAATTRQQYVSFNLNNPPSNIVPSATSENNDSVAKLKTDLERMRQEYPRQTILASNTATHVPIATNSNNAIPISVNPEWQQDQQIRTNNVNQRSTATNSIKSQPQTVAVAPVQPDSYNNIIQPGSGDMVSPELPPLAPAGQYLPNSAGQFNGYIWPAKVVLTSKFGPRWGRMHKGIDIAAPIGTPIFAAASGEVVSAGWNSGGYGNLVKIRHADGSITLYAHNSKLFVANGQYVDQGQQISAMGSTGRSTGPHLHFEVHPGGGSAVNPIAFLPKK